MVELVGEGARRLVLQLLRAVHRHHVRHAGRDECGAALVGVARGDEDKVERRLAVLALGARGDEVGEALDLERVRAAQTVLEGDTDGLMSLLLHIIN